MKNLRTEKIYHYINQNKTCSIAELMDRFKISHATIQRDITALTNQGRIRRYRGGVLSQPEEEPAAFSHYQDRLDRNRENKAAVARKALETIEDGDIIFLDSSTTVHYLAKELQKTRFSHLTVITNSLLVIREFPSFPPGYFMVALGGNYDMKLSAFLGQATLGDLERLKIDKAFVSAFGIAPEGISTLHENHSYFLRRVLELARFSYLLATSDKFGKVGLFNIAPLSMLHAVVANEPLPDGLSLS